MQSRPLGGQVPKAATSSAEAPASVSPTLHPMAGPTPLQRLACQELHADPGGPAREERLASSIIASIMA